MYKTRLVQKHVTLCATGFAMLNLIQLIVFQGQLLVATHCANYYIIPFSGGP